MDAYLQSLVSCYINNITCHASLHEPEQHNTIECSYGHYSHDLHGLANN